MKLMLFPEKHQAQFLSYKEKRHGYPLPLLSEMGIYVQIYSKLLNRFKDIELDTKDPDLIIYTKEAFNRQKIFPSAYPNMRKIMICGEDIHARKPYYDRIRYRLLKLSNSLHLNKKITSQLTSIRIPLYKRKYEYRQLRARAFIENLKPHEFSILTNDYMGAKTQREQIFNYPYFMRFNPALYGIIKAHREKRIHNYRKRKFCCYIQRRHTPERKIFLEMLSQYKKVDCYGLAGFNNPSVIEDPRKIWPGRYSYTNNHQIFQRYKFVIAFENSIAKDYITEKLVMPMYGNAIPLYLGAPNVNKYFNPDSFLNYDNYESLSAMARAVIELDQDEQRYQAMLQQPFFPDNRLPAAITDIRRDFDHFLDRALDL